MMYMQELWDRHGFGSSVGKAIDFLYGQVGVRDQKYSSRRDPNESSSTFSVQ